MSSKMVLHPPPQLGKPVFTGSTVGVTAAARMAVATIDVIGLVSSIDEKSTRDGW